MGELSNDVSGALQSARNVGSDVLAAGKGAYQAAAPAVGNFVHEHPVASGITGGLAAGAGATALLYHLLHKRHDQGKTATAEPEVLVHGHAAGSLAALQAEEEDEKKRLGYNIATGSPAKLNSKKKKKTIMDKTAHDALTKLAEVEAKDRQNAFDAGFALACNHMGLNELQYKQLRKVAADRANDTK
jgi:hypothetical protein